MIRAMNESTSTTADEPTKPTGPEWVGQFAALLGLEPPTESEIAELLALAGTAAHASERTAAPIACWLVGRAGVTAREAHDLAATLDA